MSRFVKEKSARSEKSAGSQIVMVKTHVAIKCIWQPSVQKSPVDDDSIHFQEDQTFQDQ